MVQCWQCHIYEFDSVNECTQEISALVKLHIQRVWQIAPKFIRQLVYYCI